MLKKGNLATVTHKFTVLIQCSVVTIKGELQPEGKRWKVIEGSIAEAYLENKYCM